MDFAVLADHREKNQRKRKKRQVLELKAVMEHEGDGGNNCGCALGTIPKSWVGGLELMEIGGQAETIQITALLKLARILRRVLETSGD